MQERVFLLKPCRLKDEQESMDENSVLARLCAGIETVVVLDLNILNTLKDFISPEIGKVKIHLTDEIEKIKKVLQTPGIFITPGFALGEVDESYLIPMMDAYEKFLKMEFPSYIDAPNSTANAQDRKRSRKYAMLPEEDQHFFGATYLALLKIHQILLCEARQSPEAKFDLYLEYMDGVADFVPGLETEVAKVCFSNPIEFRDTELARKCALIRDNFDKNGRGEKRVDRILNGARDIMYIRSAAMIDGKTLDGRLQDTWLLTRDSAIAAFNSLIYFAPKDGEQSKYTALANDPTRKAYNYWRYVDKAAHRLLEVREVTHRYRKDFGNDAHFKQLAKKALDLNLIVAALP